MDWKMGRRILAGLGIIYVFALIPSSIRPRWTASPFAKPDQTITIQAATSTGFPPADYKSKIASACKANTLLRPVMGSAKNVHVIYEWNGQPVAVHDYHCELYV